MNENDNPNTAQYKGKKPWHFNIESDFVRSATGTSGKRLSAPARLLYLIIKSYVGPTSPVPFPRIGTIASYMHMGEEAVRRYMRELVRGGWLKVEQRRLGCNQFGSNAYILLDGGKPSGQKPTTDLRSAAELDSAEPSAALPETKSTQGEEEARVKDNQRSEEITNNNTAPSGAGGVDAADPTPSAICASTRQTPKEKAKAFIENYHSWAEAAGLPSVVSVRDKDALREFFQDNPRTTVQEMTAILLGCFLAKPKVDDPDEEHPDTREPFWYCLKKGRRISTMLDFLTNIQDELSWKGSEEQINRIYEMANKKFKELQRQAK